MIQTVTKGALGLIAGLPADSALTMYHGHTVLWVMLDADHLAEQSRVEPLQSPNCAGDDPQLDLPSRPSNLGWTPSKPNVRTHCWLPLQLPYLTMTAAHA